MKKIILFLLTIIILVSLNKFYNSDITSSTKQELKIFKNILDINGNIEFIKVLKNNETTLLKKNKNWEIFELGNYFAVNSSILSMLKDINTSKVLDKYDVNDKNKTILGFNKDNNTKISLKNKIEKNIFIGNTNEKLGYSYVLFENFIYKLSGNFNYSDKNFFWAQKMILDIGIDFITNVKVVNSKSSFSFSNVNDNFLMGSPKIKVKRDKAYSILNSFSDLYSENIIYPKVIPKKNYKQIKVVLYLIDGVVINITIFQKDHLNYLNIDSIKKGHSLLFDSYMTRFDKEWTYVIPNLVFENLSIPKSDLIN